MVSAPFSGLRNWLFFWVVIISLGYIFIIVSILKGNEPGSSNIRDRSSQEPSDSLLVDEAKKQVEATRQMMHEIRRNSKKIEDGLRRDIKRLKSSKAEIQKNLDFALKNLKVANPQNKPALLEVQAPIESKVFRQGVIVLGMHRSGTSVLGGLLNKMGLNVGGPLIQGAADNEKGFFERIDVVLQNDYIMKKQQVYYGGRTAFYDENLGLKHVLDELHAPKRTNFFNEGARGLAFLNDRKNYPWMLKDPRLCITLRTWLPLLEFVPAVVFAYRHPIDVALSLKKREFERYKISRSLVLWYVYNRRAVQQSHDLCRVVVAHKNTMKRPQEETDRIFSELHACGVRVPRRLSIADVNTFVDIKLQHGRNDLQQDDPCSAPGGTAKMLPPPAWPTQEEAHLKLFRECMRVYCAFEDHSAFSPDFVWDNTIVD